MAGVFGDVMDEEFVAKRRAKMKLIEGAPDSCDFCGAEEGPSVKLSRCSRCRTARFCGKECQLRAWKEKKEDFCYDASLFDESLIVIEKSGDVETVRWNGF